LFLDISENPEEKEKMESNDLLLMLGVGAGVSGFLWYISTRKPQETQKGPLETPESKLS